jgi:hypothetical protein
VIIDEAFQVTEIGAISVVATFPLILILAGDLKAKLIFCRSYVHTYDRNEFSKAIEKSLMERMMQTRVPSIFLGIVGLKTRPKYTISSVISRTFYEGL